MLISLLFTAALAATPTLAAAQSERGDRALNKSTYLAGAEKRFDKADADDDGALTREEHASLRLAEFDEGDRDGNGVISRGEIRGLEDADISTGLTRERFEKRTDNLYTKIADGAETISKERYLDASEAFFDEADRNEDGLITRGELRGLTQM